MQIDGQGEGSERHALRGWSDRRNFERSRTGIHAIHGLRVSKVQMEAPCGLQTKDRCAGARIEQKRDRVRIDAGMHEYVTVREIEWNIPGSGLNGET